MKLYKISQSLRTGYDTFSAAIVHAPDAKAAAAIHPATQGNEWADPIWSEERGRWYQSYYTPDDIADEPDGWHDWSWCDSPSQVTVEEIGEGAEGLPPGLVLASFHAG